jgi:hypothetical protein
MMKGAINKPIQLDCAICQLLEDMAWPLASEFRDDDTVRRRRRMILHVRLHMTPEERAAWLRAGGVGLLADEAER